MTVAGGYTSLLLLPMSFLLLFPFVISSVYYIKPDNQHANISANTLDYYLQDATKYLASNNQLYFLPGVYKLNTVIKIQNVYNFSLIGIDTNNNSIIIKCLSAGKIAIINSSFINIKHVIMKRCKGKLSVNSIPGFTEDNYKLYVSLLIKNSYSINIHQLTLSETQSYDIILINVLSDSTLSKVSSSGILVVYENYKNVQPSEHNLTITKYYPISLTNCYKLQDYCYKIEIALLDHFYHLNINISEITFNTEDSILIKSQTCNGFNKVTIFNCNFTNIIMSTANADDEPPALIRLYFTSCDEVYFHNHMTQINVLKCYFFYNMLMDYYNGSGYIIIMRKDYPTLYNWVTMHISDSEVFGNECIAFLMSRFVFINRDLLFQPINITINNTRFADVQLYRKDNPFVNLYGVVLQLVGPIIFTEINVFSVIVFGDRTRVYADGYIEFSSINTVYIVKSTMFYLNINAVLNFTSNVAIDSLIARGDATNSLYPPCMLQYVGNSDNYKEADVLLNLSVSIIIYDNEFSHFCENLHCTSHCSWDSNTVFDEISPLYVNRKVIKNLQDNSTLITDRKDICYCKDDQYDCYVDEINHVYPGQTVHLNFMNTLGYTVPVTVLTGLPTSCRVSKSSQLVQLVYNNCTNLQYTMHHSKKWCELFLSYSQTDAAVFYVNLLSCPLGFSLDKLEGYCQCDPILTSARIIPTTGCNINDQTILHPGNSWIHIASNHTYRVSLRCPFHYCLPYPSYLNLSNPDSQCQFSRSGVLCGRCKSGLSTMFGTLQCKHCSNTFLSVTVGIIFAGIMLVLLLFTINLTVADGTINAFIFYINVVSINNFSVLTHRQTSAARIFVSLSNLDLGFEMCFYNGMDDYIKIWLQLAFPVYLIIIATSLIIASRYSTRIQRLTARRALAVLATLFLLSYTKILRTVSNVLFFYSTITDLPSNKTTIVWSVDANVPLFGAKLAILFTSCLILLIIMIPFTVVLTFTRLLSRHKNINYFKPLLDAYQGPYKNHCYFWPGLQLMMRVIFFGLSGLDKNINLAIGVVLLAALLGIHGYVHPFKNSFKNIQELIFIFNLIMLFTFVQFENTNNIIVNTLVAIASLHFVIILLNNLWLYQCLAILESISRKYKNVVNLKQYIASKWRHCIKRNQPHNNNMHNMPLRDMVPEVAYNFKEYREPLIGQDN